MRVGSQPLGVARLVQLNAFVEAAQGALASKEKEHGKGKKAIALVSNETSWLKR